MSQRITKLVIRMPEELHLQLRQQASERHQSMNTVALLGIARELNRPNDMNPEVVQLIESMAFSLAAQTLKLIGEALSPEQEQPA